MNNTKQNSVPAWNAIDVIYNNNKIRFDFMEF